MPGFPASARPTQSTQAVAALPTAVTPAQQQADRDADAYFNQITISPAWRGSLNRPVSIHTVPSPQGLAGVQLADYQSRWSARLAHRLRVYQTAASRPANITDQVIAGTQAAARTQAAAGSAPAYPPSTIQGWWYLRRVYDEAYVANLTQASGQASGR